MKKPRHYPPDAPNAVWSLQVLQALDAGNLDAFRDLLRKADKEDLNGAVTVAGGKSLLHKAVELRREKFVRALIRAGADPDVRDTDRKTPLHHAARKGYCDIIDTLCAGYATIDARDRSDRTPFHTACQMGQVDAAETLRGRGADIHAGDMTGWTGLHLAAISEHDEAVLEAIQALGVDVNQRDNISWTALHWVCESDQPDAARALLKIGADPMIISDDDLDAMDMAMRKNNPDVVMVLREHASLGHSHRIKRLRQARRMTPFP